MSYPFASGKIRVLEKSLPDKVDIDRMVDAESAEKSFQVFNDTDLSDNLLNIQPHDFEKAIYADMIQMRDFAKQVSPDPKLFEFLFIKNDFHNIKVLLKSKMEGKSDYQEKIIPFGVFEAKDIENYIMNEDRKSLASELFTKSLDKIIKAPSLDKVDPICDKEYFNTLIGYTKKIKSNFITQLLISEIDFSNLRLALRVKDNIKDLHISGGNISSKKLAELQEGKDDKVVEYLKSKLTRSELKIFENYFAERKLWQFEKAVDDVLLAHLKEARKISFGPEVIVAYIKAKEIAFRNIRLIMTARLNGVEPIIIKERIRNVF